jgi:hypothetical protein
MGAQARVLARGFSMAEVGPAYENFFNELMTRP